MSDADEDLPKAKKQDWRYRIFTPLVLLVILTIVNLVNYVDRGIIAGAGTSIQGCDNDYTIDHTHTTNESMCHEPTVTFFCSKDCNSYDNVSVCGSAGQDEVCCREQTGYGIDDTALGFLQSAFMIGYVVAILIFGHLANRYPPFKLIGTGLSIWCIAILASGLCGPRYFNTYYGLLAARVFSGVGEASFQAIATPFIDDYAPRKRKSCWMAVFFTAIPVGTALGYVWAGAISNVLSWEWAFLLEAPVMFPFAMLCFFMPHKMKNRKNSGHNSDSNPHETNAIKAPLLEQEVTDVTAEAQSDEASPKHASIVQEFMSVCTSPVCVLVIAGYSQYTATTAGFSFFGPKYIQEHKGDAWCQFSQLNADLVFGILIVVSGIIGTTLGGIALDVFSRKKTGHSRLIESMKHIVIESILGGITMFACSFMQNPYLFFALLGLGSALLFCTTAAVNIAIMASVPTESRAFAIALATVTVHLFGDVPSPIFIGLLSDKEGPEFTLVVMSLWVIWCVLFWGAAWILTLVCQSKKEKEESSCTAN